MNNNNRKPRVAITAGDLNGIGYEVILKALNEPYLTEICVPIIYGNLSIAEKVKSGLEDMSLKLNLLQKAGEEKENHVYVVNCYADDVAFEPGNPTQAAGQCALASLARAVSDLRDGLVQVLVTAPFNKDTVQTDKFRYHGHTEFLQAVFGGNSLMMMISENLRVALVTNHLPIAEVASAINQELIIDKLKTLNSTLQRDFTIRKPRIAVLALNPHAGDNGLLGTEETEVIAPAIKTAYEQGIMCFGPFAADGFFGASNYNHYDAVLAMYHDQGLVGFKTIDMSGVNFTAGLPVIRTSPDHGTAFDIAGKNLADAQSMRHAIWEGIDIWKRRNINDEVSADPLVVTDKHNNRREDN